MSGRGDVLYFRWERRHSTTSSRQGKGGGFQPLWPQPLLSWNCAFRIPRSDSISRPGTSEIKGVGKVELLATDWGGTLSELQVRGATHPPRSTSSSEQQRDALHNPAPLYGLTGGPSSCPQVIQNQKPHPTESSPPQQNKGRRHFSPCEFLANKAK